MSNQSSTDNNHSFFRALKARDNQRNQEPIKEKFHQIMLLNHWKILN